MLTTHITVDNKLFICLYNNVIRIMGDKDELVAFRENKKVMDKLRKAAKQNDRPLSAEIRRRLKRSWEL